GTQSEGVFRLQSLCEGHHAFVATYPLQHDLIEQLLRVECGAVTQIRERTTRLPVDAVAGTAVGVVTIFTERHLFSRTEVFRRIERRHGEFLLRRQLCRATELEH